MYAQPSDLLVIHLLVFCQSLFRGEMSLQEEQIADLDSSNVGTTCRQLRDYVQFELR